MNPLFEMRKFTRFGLGLRRYLRTPLSLDDSRRRVGYFLAHREDHFLSVMEKAIYGRDQHPYHRLLRLAGISLGGLRRMVKADGLEGALAKLRDAGVYLTIDEFKCRIPVQRHGETIATQASDFDNPYLSQYFTGATGGSRGAGTRTMIDLEFVADRAPANALAMDAHGAWDLPFFIWFPILPGVAGLRSMLKNAKAGMYAARWFTQVWPDDVRASLVNRMGMAYILGLSRLFGVPLPRPEYVPLTDPLPVAVALAEAVRTHGGARLTTFASSGARVCHAAKEAGLDLTGVRILVGGEPLTEARVAEMKAVGVRTIHVYYSAETSIIGAACATTDAHDDLHLFHDALAVIPRCRTIPGTAVEIDSLLFTSLLPSAPKILLNVELGDTACLETRPCDCTLGALGLVHHLRGIRSFEKLTGEGMTLLGTDLIRILEESILPQFGGTSTDYQFVQSTVNGATQLAVRIRPALGPVDGQAVIRTLMAGLARGSDGDDLARAVWAQAGTLSVERAEPSVTATGKVLPLHILE